MVELKIWDNDDSVDVEEEVYIPPNHVLSQNFPNPFNPSTNISYDIPEQTHVIIKVSDVLGKLIITLVDGIKSAGSYNIQFNASNLPTGMYVLQMRAGDSGGFRKMILVK
jgi:hypothetical protein